MPSSSLTISSGNGSLRRAVRRSLMIPSHRSKIVHSPRAPKTVRTPRLFVGGDSPIGEDRQYALTVVQGGRMMRLR